MSTARSSKNGWPRTEPGVSGDVEGHDWGPAAGPLDGPFHQDVEPDLDGFRLRFVLSSQLDDVPDQGRHLLQLGVHVLEQLGPVRLGQVLDA